MSIRFFVVGLICFMCSCRNEKLPKDSYLSKDGSYALLPGNIIQSNQFTDCQVEIVPTGNQPLTLFYTLADKKFPGGWDIAICDNKGCHLEIPDTCSLNQISVGNGGDSNKIKLLIEANGIKGKGQLIICLHNNCTEMVDTLQFRIEI